MHREAHPIAVRDSPARGQPHRGVVEERRQLANHVGHLAVARPDLERLTHDAESTSIVGIDAQVIRDRVNRIEAGRPEPCRAGR